MYRKEECNSSSFPSPLIIDLKMPLFRSFFSRERQHLNLFRLYNQKFSLPHTSFHHSITEKLIQFFYRVSSVFVIYMFQFNLKIGTHRFHHHSSLLECIKGLFGYDSDDLSSSHFSGMQCLCGYFFFFSSSRDAFCVPGRIFFSFLFSCTNKKS